MTVKIGSWEIGRYPGETDPEMELRIAWAIYVLKTVKLDKSTDFIRRYGDVKLSIAETITLLEAIRHDPTVKPEDALPIFKREGFYVVTILALHHFSQLAYYFERKFRGQLSGLLFDLFATGVVLRSEWSGNSEWPGSDNEGKVRDGLRSVFDKFDLDWEMRERLRFHAGIYQPVPWTSPEPIPGHYAHVSVTEPGAIAYTPDGKKGAADIQVRMKPGRYITRFYPGLDTKEVQRLAAMVSANIATLRFAATPEDIERVYVNGPNSCMSHPVGDYRCEVDGDCVHPTIVYGNSDLQVAYLGNEETGKVAARCIVWPAEKRYGRCYGDEYKLSLLLRNLGYTQGSMEGAKIRKIKADKRRCYVMPYIDNHSYVSTVDKDWWRIGGCEVYVQNQGGLAGAGAAEDEYDYSCDYCEEGTNDVYSVRVSRSRTAHWCEGCRDNNSYRCGLTDDDFSDDWTSTTEIREMVWTSVFVEFPDGRRAYHSYPSGNYVDNDSVDVIAEDEAYAFHCDRNLQYYCVRSVRQYDMANGETWSQEAFDEDGIEVDGKFYPKDDAPVSVNDQPDLPFTAEHAVAAAVPASA